MKKVALFIALSMSSISFGQENYEAIYSETLINALGSETTTHSLLFNNFYSLYERIDEIPDNEIIEKRNEKGELRTSIKRNNIEEKWFFFRDRQENKVYFNDESAIKQYNIYDTIQITWTIKDEIKKIGTHQCKKAESIFRGRSYIAWFSTEIPIPFGPKKFYGLPGLILEIHDKENVKYHAIIESLKTKAQTDNDNLKKFRTSKPQNIFISFSDFWANSCKDAQEFKSIMLSRVPEMKAKDFKIESVGSLNNLEKLDIECQE